MAGALRLAAAARVAAAPRAAARPARAGVGRGAFAPKAALSFSGTVRGDAVKAVSVPATSLARRLGFLTIECGGKCKGCTVEGTKRKRARTSGFRARMATPAGRNVLKRRRAKGRK